MNRKKPKVRTAFKDAWKQKPVRIYLLAFAVPIVILCIVFAVLNVYPFGNRQILLSDAWHQYYPFFTELHRKLRGGESLLYTSRIGMGNGFVALFAYYLASPLNLFLILLPAGVLLEAFQIFVMIKIGLAGVFCAFALSRTEEKDDYGVVIFSTLYALCGWLICYFWNTMWLDTFAVFPLVALGIRLLVKEKKYKLYTISLAIAVFSNYYIGLMVCIFTAFYFFVQCAVCKNGIRELLRNLRNIIVFSVLSLMISALATLPTVITLQSAYKGSNGPKQWKLVKGWGEMLADSFAFKELTYSENIPAIYCGVACVVLTVVFCCLAKTTKREKLAYMAMVLILYVSTNVNILDYLWHGMHITNSLPYRYTFIFSFLLVLLSYQAYLRIETLSGKGCIAAGIGSALYFGFVAAYYVNAVKKGSTMSPSGEFLKDETVLLRFLLKNLALIAAYLIFIILASRKIIRRRVFALLLAGVVCIELLATVMTGMKKGGTTSKEGYPARYSEIQEIIGDIEAQEDEDDFYRMEQAKHYTLNAPALYGYRGLSVFSSTANVSVTNVFENLGLLARPAANRYYYQNATPVVNMFLNLKYLISREGEIANQEYFSEFRNVDGVIAYKNEAYLPIGFMVEKEMGDFSFEGDTPFEKQNNLVKAATGIEEDVFDALDIIHVGHKNLYVTRSAYGNYNYRTPDDGNSEEAGNFKFNYEMPRDSSVYAFMEPAGSTTVKVESDNDTKSYAIYHKGTIFPAGTYQKGEIFSIRQDSEAGKSGHLRIYVSMLNQEVFDRAYEILKDEPLHVTKCTSRSLKGDITAKKDGLMYTSIPYEKGWKAYVDGKQADIVQIGDAFIGVVLSAGEHTVELKYSPSHVYLAALIMLAGCAAFAAICLLERKRKQRISK